MVFESRNPWNEELIGTYRAHSDGELSETLGELRAGVGSLALMERKDALLNLSQALSAHRDELALLATQEMGKPLKQSRAEVEKCSKVCAYYASTMEKYLSDRDTKDIGSRAVTTLQPLGVVLAIMPWNFPFWQVIRVLAPQMALGNSVALKHASNVMGCATRLEELVSECVPGQTFFRALRVDGAGASRLIEDPRISAVTLTGSELAGRKVAEVAGRYLKKTVLELGGSDPYIVLEDADLDLAVEACVRSRTINSGQSCVAAKRFIVDEKIYGEFETRFVEAFKELRVGDPMLEGTSIGPLAKKEAVEELERLLQTSEGDYEILYRGSIPSQGYFFSPTVARVKSSETSLFQEETFGPLAALISVPGEEEALRVANDSGFGLGAAIFTRNVEKGWALARGSLRAGTCAVNGMVQSHPELPFGGVGRSGYGRELAEIGLWEFANVKSVVMS